MILDLDIGNTRIKWRLSEKPTGHILQAGVSADLTGLSSIFVNVAKVDRVRIACVRREKMCEELTQWSQELFCKDPEFARVTRQFAGLEVYYQDLTHLGVDRWLAMLAVRRVSSGSFVVVDCGTALTVDLVNDKGQHQGGYIVPGFGLCITALQEHTAIRLGDIPQNLETSPGHSTDHAVYNGVVTMLSAFIVNAAASPATKVAVVYLTGGDRELLNRHLTEAGLQSSAVDGLVLDGLAAALP
ncbi:MAG: type III pantothenate kinase [Pseudohongiellaceae bacterium]